MLERYKKEDLKSKTKPGSGENPPKKVPSREIMVPVCFTGIDFQKVEFFGFHEVTKNQKDLDNLRFIFEDCNSDLVAGCFGGKIRVFKFGFEEIPSAKPLYTVVMLNEVKDKIVNEKVKGNLYKLSNDVIIFSCYFNDDGVFDECFDIYNVAHVKGNKKLLTLNLTVFNPRIFELISPNKLVWR